MIKDRSDKGKQDYPFDVRHRRVINYDNTITGGQEFRKVLGDTIDFVLSKTLAEFHQQSEIVTENEVIATDKLDELLHHSRLQFAVRARRIEWFTYHAIHFLARFAKFHTDILKELEQLHIRFSSGKFEIVKKRCAGYIPNPSYIRDFILEELENTKNFISNAWLVNKFPDELKSFGLGGMLTYLSTLEELMFEFKYEDIKEGITFNLERLNFYINAMQDERTEVGLRVVNLDKLGFASNL